MFHIFQGLEFVVFEIPWTFGQVERYETKSPSEAETKMRVESMRSHPSVVCHGGFKLGIVGRHVSQKLKVEALKIQSHERHGQNVCEWTEFMWVSLNSRQRSYLAFQPANSAQMSRIPISSSGIPRSCSMLRGNCHESCQRKSHAILRNISKWEILHASKHGARCGKKKSLVKHKFLWWKCVLTKTLVSFSTLFDKNPFVFSFTSKAGRDVSARRRTCGTDDPEGTPTCHQCQQRGVGRCYRG